ncbi:hypothetical protein [Phocaeicola sp.]
MMKYISTIFFLLLFFSCLDTTEDIIPENPTPEDPVPPTNNYHLKLGAEQNAMNIFTMAKFSLLDEDKNGLHVTDWELAERYDSLTWIIAGQKGSQMLFSWELGDGFAGTSLTFGWSHNFYLPGHYETCLLGYKDNKIIYSDTLAIDVSNQKDFLMYNWNEIEGIENKGGIGYHNAINENYTLGTFPQMHGKVPSVELSFWNSLGEDENKFAQKCDTELYNYICSVYQQPAFDRDSQELADKYNTLFAYKAKNATPHAIWLTTKSKIVLLMKEKEDWNEACIYAEPLD